MEDNEKQYIKGFNNGYLIALHQPDLFEKLEKGLKNSNDYTRGFLLGGKEHEKEKKIIDIKNFKTDKNYSDKKQNKDIDHDK